MQVTVIGTGYVGLVTGACLASVGNLVHCVDVDVEKIDLLNRGGCPIYEPGLEELLAKHSGEGRLKFTTDARVAAEAEIVFIAVGTPTSPSGAPDLTRVFDAVSTVAPHLRPNTVLVCKSTVPVGTCARIRALLAQITSVDFHVVSNPEFLKEGSALSDFRSPDRVVIGSDSDVAFDAMHELYGPFLRRQDRIVRMGIRSAEMTKYASNALLATKISFINEIAALCEAKGADVEEVRIGMSFDERIGPHFLFPGVGYGGSCFPKDLRALVSMGEELNVTTDIVRSVERVNQKQKEILFELAQTRYGTSLHGSTFGFWGLSFKPRTDDLREAPALITIRKLLAHGARVRLHDPVARDEVAKRFSDNPHVVVVDNEYDAVADASALFIHTEWEIYRAPDFARLRRLMKEPTIFDGRNLFQPARVSARGFTYYSIGRKTAFPSTTVG